MSRTANKIIAALGIPASKVWVIGPYLTAVDPSYLLALQKYVGDSGQLPYKKWLEKSYRASERMMNATDRVTVLHKDGHLPLVATTADLCMKTIPRTAATDPNYGKAQNGSMPVTIPTVVSMLSGTGQVATVMRNSTWYEGNTPITMMTPDAVDCRPLSYKVGMFCGIEIGQNGSVSVNYRNAPALPAGPVGAQFLSAVPAQYIVESLKPNVASDLRVGWILIEGPAVLTYGELYAKNRTVYTEAFGYFAATRADIADALEQRIIQDGSKPDLNSIADLRKDPAGGVVLAWTGKAAPDTPYELVPEWQPFAADLMGMTVVEDVDVSKVPTRWAAGGEFIGAYSGLPEDLDTGIARWIAETLPGATSVAMSVQDGGQIIVKATKADGTEIDPSSIDVTLTTAPSIIRSLRAMGVSVSFTYSNVAFTTFNADVVNARAELVRKAIGNAAPLTADGDGGAIGRAIVGSILQPASADQRRVMSIMIRPGVLEQIQDGSLVD